MRTSKLLALLFSVSLLASCGGGGGGSGSSSNSGASSGTGTTPTNPNDSGSIGSDGSGNNGSDNSGSTNPSNPSSTNLFVFPDGNFHYNSKLYASDGTQAGTILLDDFTLPIGLPDYTQYDHGKYPSAKYNGVRFWFTKAHDKTDDSKITVYVTDGKNFKLNIPHIGKDFLKSNFQITNNNHVYFISKVDRSGLGEDYDLFYFHMEDIYQAYLLDLAGDKEALADHILSIIDVVATPYGVMKDELVAVGSSVYFTASDSYNIHNISHNTELWSATGASASMFHNIYIPHKDFPANSNPRNLFNYNGHIAYSARSWEKKTKLVSWDGSETGCASVDEFDGEKVPNYDPSRSIQCFNVLYKHDYYEQPYIGTSRYLSNDHFNEKRWMSNDVSSFFAFNNNLYFTAINTNGDYDLWRISNTPLVVGEADLISENIDEELEFSSVASTSKQTSERIRFYLGRFGDLNLMKIHPVHNSEIVTKTITDLYPIREVYNVGENGLAIESISKKVWILNEYGDYLLVKEPANMSENIDIVHVDGNIAYLLHDSLLEQKLYKLEVSLFNPIANEFTLTEVATLP